VIALRAGEPIRYCNTWIFGVLLFFMLFLLGAGMSFAGNNGKRRLCIFPAKDIPAPNRKSMKNNNTPKITYCSNG